MATWDELFLNKEYINDAPQAEIIKFIQNVHTAFPTENIKIWDLCCGAGRHSVLASRMGCDVFSSDVSPNGIAYLKQSLEKNDLNANCKIADMTETVWPDTTFHGILCWDALHHNTLSNIGKAIDVVYKQLHVGGFFICTLLSARSGSYHKGTEIEKNTYISDVGPEAGVPHHYFDDDEILSIFKGWKIIVLGEKVVRYLDKTDDFYKINPFAYTKWEVYLQKV
jgi:2-polyprenyl-3-methyl-5-hydroxy-6-metoxy-1,4-benzoquinol methylase